MLLNITPVPKPRMTQRDKWAKRPAVVRYYAFCDGLRELWGDEKVGEHVTITFALPMPKSWPKTRRASMTGHGHKQRPDIDNLLKAFLDALCEDDSHVWDVHATKIWADSEGYIRVDHY